MNAHNVSRISTTLAIIASLWCRNRRRMVFHCALASTVNSRSSPGFGCGSTGASVSSASSRLITSAIANPRIKVGVDDVGNQIEQDDEHGGDHDERQQR